MLIPAFISFSSPERQRQNKTIYFTSESANGRQKINNPAKTNIIRFLSFSLERGQTNREQINVWEEKGENKTKQKKQGANLIPKCSKAKECGSFISSLNWGG